MKTNNHRVRATGRRLALRPLPLLLLGALYAQAPVYAQEAPARRPAQAAPQAADPKPATPKPATTKPATQAEPKPDQPVGEMQTVTVVAERPAEQIDRSVYDVKSEVVTPNASAADVVANVPNVTVDQDGKVAIRGNQNTQIFVNGKRSAMFSGANAGDALNSYPAEALESIEVITTPGAEFGSEGGSGPILNLVTRRVRPPGSQGAVSASVGPGGRRNASLFGSYNTGRLQVEGQTGYTRNLQERTGYADTDTQVGNAVWTTHRDILVNRTPSETFNFNPTVSYNVGEMDRASAALTFNRTNRSTDSSEYYLTSHGGPSPYEQYQRDIDRDSRTTIYQLALSYERKFTRDEVLTFDLRNSGNDTDSDSRNRNTYAIVPPTGPRLESTNGNNTTSHLTEFSLDYRKKVSPNVNFKVGAKVGRNTGSTDADYFYIDPLTGEEEVVDNANSALRSTERSWAVYFTPNIRLSEHWMMMPGVRYERIDRHVDYLNQDSSASDTSRKFLPSLHLQYGWSDNATLTGAFSRRISRPSLADLNPTLQYVDDQTYTLGDPRLAPTHADKYELKYSDKFASVDTNISLYREQESPLLGRSLTPVPGSTVVISEAVNFGDKTTDGIGFNFQAKPTSTLNFGATLNLQHLSQSYLARQVNADGLNYTVETERKVYPKTLQLRAQYSGIPGHRFQLNGNYTGRRLVGLSEYEPTWQVQAAWMYNLTDRLTLRASVRDVFDSNTSRSRQISDTVTQYAYSDQKGRIVTVGLSYRFGGVTGDQRLRENGGMFRRPGGPDGPRGEGGGWGGPGGGGGFGPGPGG